MLRQPHGHHGSHEVLSRPGQTSLGMDIEVFDLLSTPNQKLVKAFLQQMLTVSTLNEVYILATFKLQPKSTAVVFGIYSPTENRKYFEFTVMGRVNKVSLRYLRNNGKLNAVFFSNVPLADGKRHAILLRLNGLPRGSGQAELYVDCVPVDAIQELPKAFLGLSQNSESLEIRTLQRKAQDTLEDLKLVAGGSLSQVAGLQDCFLPQIEPAVQYPGVSTSDFNRQLLGHMMQMNQILGDVKDLLRQQVKETTFLRNTIAECQACGLGAGSFPTPPPTPPKPKCEANSCFRGVRCTDTSDGFQCGPCPEGFTGNGVICTDVDECRYNPCFPGVRCVNMAPGFRCEACPPGYTGQIVQGLGINSAKNNKQVCSDIDECQNRNGDCVSNSQCINTV
ncbi:Thrombospondin-4, partial [Varanus komodoensis]